MPAPHTLNLASTFPAYKLKYCCLVLVFIYKFARWFCRLKTGVNKALHENDQELMGILLPTNAIALPYLFKLLYYHLRVSPLLLINSFEVLRV
jgi:hypothetical protein